MLNHTPAPLRATCLAGLAVIGLLASPLTAAEVSTAEVSKFALGIEAGTTGFGPSLHYTASSKISVTVGYAWLKQDEDINDSDSDYTGKVSFSNLSAIVNWHPFEGKFHLSAGAFISDNSIEITAKPKPGTLYDIGDNLYSASQVGSLVGDIKLGNGFAPYLGLGWSKTPTAGGFGVYADIGVMFTGSPETSFRATGPIASNAGFQADLAKETRSVNDDLDSLKIYPVIRFGLMYRF